MLPRFTMWVAMVSGLSAVAAAVIVRLWPTPGGAVQEIARVCALLCLAWSVGGAVMLRMVEPSKSAIAGHGSLGRTTPVVALLFGVVTAIVLSILLAMRAVCVAVDLMHGYPFPAIRGYGFDAAGLWNIGFLFAACVVADRSTGDRRLAACQLWCAAMMVSWACLLTPVLRATDSGAHERTGIALWLTASLSLVLLLFVLINRWRERRRSGMRVLDLPRETPTQWSSLTLGVTSIAVVVIVLVSYDLAVPVVLSWGGPRLAALLAAGSAASAALASFVFVARTWSGPAADAALALSSLSLCGLATAALPSEPTALADRYPMVFNAMMFGLAAGTGLWTALATTWRMQLGSGHVGDTARRLIPHATLFAFFNGGLALVLGVIMAAWPRWQAIAATDDSLGRVAAGVSANLFLLLVTLWCSRRLHKLAFQVLTALTVVSMTGFLLTRILPFTPRFG